MGRIVVIAAVSLAVLAPGLATAAEPHYRECRKITRQMEHYEDVVNMALDRDNKLWANATVQHIQRLADRRRRLCPKMVAELEKSMARKIMDDSAEMMKAAGRVALRVFTFGAYPGPL